MRPTAALAACMLSCVLPAVAREGAAAKVARFRIETRTLFSEIPTAAQKIDAWFPIPYSDAIQKVDQVILQGPAHMGWLEIPDHKTNAAYMQSGPRGGAPMMVQIGFYAERSEEAPKGLRGASTKEPDEKDRKVGQRWLAPDPTGVTEEELKTRSSRIVTAEATSQGKARAIYEWLVGNVALVGRARELPGAGRGDLSITFKAMRGDSIDLAAAFVALSRAAGVPARTVTGWKMPPRVRSGSLDSYHGWAEFYLPGTGWVPVDPAEARRDPARKDYYFGAVDERRVALGVGREVKLVPPQASPPLNYFLRAYWECDGKTMPNPSFEVRYEELDEIPSGVIQLKPPGMP